MRLFITIIILFFRFQILWKCRNYENCRQFLLNLKTIFECCCEDAQDTEGEESEKIALDFQRRVDLVKSWSEETQMRLKKCIKSFIFRHK